MRFGKPRKVIFWISGNLLEKFRFSFNWLGGSVSQSFHGYLAWSVVSTDIWPGLLFPWISGLVCWFVVWVADTVWRVRRCCFKIKQLFHLWSIQREELNWLLKEIERAYRKITGSGMRRRRRRDLRKCCMQPPKLFCLRTKIISNMMLTIFLYRNCIFFRIFLSFYPVFRY